ncbi:acyltransferase domain-containing protein [Streptomyces sp. NPDC047917]|uniref:acyltransferase domain-containing protein n=1 Tax=Streptomyces sp. NPDC047917 TaxID=3365491 RepID=UPI00371BD350
MTRRRVVLLLPGQGAQRVRMAAGLHGVQPEFTRWMDEMFTVFGADGDKLRDIWLNPGSAGAVDEAVVAQPLLFAVGHALGRAVRSAAGAPDVLLGHSVGELVAACLAGVFAPAELATAMAGHVRRLGDTGRGGMLAVAATAEELSAELRTGAVVAAENGPRQTVLAGSGSVLAAVRGQLERRNITLRTLGSGHAFHSPVMVPAARRFGQDLGRLRPEPPGATIMSTRTARPVSAEQAVDPAFWADQMSLPVRYWPALRTLLDSEGLDPGLVLLDASPDRSLAVAARGHRAVLRGPSSVHPLLARSDRAGTAADAEAFAAAVSVLRPGGSGT